MRSTLRSIMTLLGRGLPRFSWSAARRLGIVYIVAEFFLTPGLGLVQSHAQSAACPIGAPVTIPSTTTALTLSNNNECQALVFTAQVPITVTLPAATTVAPGFQVMLISTSGGISISSAGTGSLIGNSTAGIIGSGQSAMLYGDGTNYFLSLGGGFLAQPAAGSAFANLNSSNVFPGVLLGNSPLVQVPNGVLQFTNPGSLLPADRGDIVRVCGGANKAMGAVVGQSSAWLQVFDWLQRPYKIPLC